MLAYRLISGFHDSRRTPERFAFHHILPKVNGSARAFGRVKSLSHRLLPSAPLPDVAIFVRGQLFSLEGRVTSAKAFSRDLEGDSEWVVIKSDGSAQGRGVRIVRVDEVHEAIREFPSGVIQRHLSNHSFFAPYERLEAVPIRLTSVRREDGIRVSSCHIRFQVPAPDGGLDSDVLLGVSTETGQVHDWGYVPRRGLASANDPRVRPYGGKFLPQMSSLRGEAQRLHELLPQVGIVGWDFALDSSGMIWLMEMNTAFPGIFYPELFGGPQFHGLPGHPMGFDGETRLN